MKTNRPKINVPIDTIDIILDVLSAAIVLGIMIYAFMSYSELPDTIPSHFNARGEVDGYSEKYIVWYIPLISTVLFVGLLILNKYPHIHNYMVNITEQNALKHYRFSTRIVRITNLFVTIVFGITLYAIVQSAHGHDLKLGSWFLPGIIAFSVILPVIIFIYQRKNVSK